MTTQKPEIEWQYDSKDIDIVATWLKTYPSDAALTVTEQATREQVDVYLDTADWRMLRAGYGLRIRRKSGHAEATMKSIAAAVDGLRQRREINETLSSDSDDSCELIAGAPGDVGQRVRKIVGKNPLQVLFETHTRRAVYTVTQKGRQLGEVDLDNATFPGGNPDHAISLQRIEVETAGEPQDVKDLTEFVKRMVKDCHLREAKLSKFEAGMKSRDLKPHQITGADFGPTDSDDTSSAGALAWAMLRRRFAAMLAREPGARLGEDAEEVHLMRVAIRRLRAAFSLFRDALPQSVNRIRTELSWVATELGATRDLDVMIEQINLWVAKSADADADADADAANAHRAVVDLLTALRAEEHQRLLDIFDSRRYEKFAADFSRMLRKPPSGPSWADTPARTAMPELIKDRYRKGRKAGDKLQPDSPAPDYHQLRIRIKRLRYGLEFTKGLYGKPVSATLTGMRALQDTLGMYQDTQIAIARLQAIKTERQDTLPPETISAIDAVARHYEQRAVKLLDRFPKAYQHLKGKTWKRLWEAMKADK